MDQVLNVTLEDGEDVVKAALKQLFTHIMSASENVVADVLSQLISRLRKKEDVSLFIHVSFWIYLYVFSLR